MRAAFAALQARCRADVNAFSEWVFRDERGAPTRQGAIQRVMHTHVSFCWKAGKHPGFLGPVEHTKTQQLLTVRGSHELGLDQSLRIKIVCAGDDNAMKRVVGLESLLRSPFYRSIFPKVRFLSPAAAKRQGKKSKQTSHQLTLDREGHAIDPSVESMGIFGAGTGGRADLIFFDDVVELRNAILEPERRPQVLTSIDETWMSRLTANGRVTYMGQPWHEDDATSNLQKRPAWCFLEARISDDFKKIDLEVVNPPAGYPLPEKLDQVEGLEGLGKGALLKEKKFPPPPGARKRVQLRPIKLYTERRDPWDEAALRKKHEDNENSFNRRFRLRMVRDGDLTFPNFKRAELPTVLGEAQRAAWPCVIGVDLSSKKRPGKCAVAVKVEPRTYRRFVVDVRFIKGDAGTFLDHISDMASAYRPAQIAVEDNGTQDIFLDMIGRAKNDYPWWMKIEAVTTTSESKFKGEASLPGLDVEFKNGAWVFPLLEYDGVQGEADADEGSPEIRRMWWRRLASEFHGHPVATTSDGVMATLFARQAIENLGMLLFGRH